MQFLIEIDSKEVDRMLEEVPRRAKSFLADGLDHATRSFLSFFHEERLQGEPGIKNHGGIFHRFRRVTYVNGRKIFLRTRASQTDSVKAISRSAKSPLDIRVEIYTDSKAAGIHERGGTIRSSRGMAIPLGEEGKKMRRDDISLKTLIPIMKNGKLFLAKEDALKNIRFLFFVTKSVRIKPRLGFYKAWDNHAPRRLQILNAAFQKAVGA